MDWDAVFAEIGFPAFLKQHMGGGWANVYKVHDPDELFRAYDQTGELVMMLQEAIDFEQFVRCLVIGKRHVSRSGTTRPSGATTSTRATCRPS